MIFYFTGTGNSLQTAKTIGETLGESLIDIAEAVKKKSFSYELEEFESVGFVFPVYFWGLPSIVVHFLNHLEFAKFPEGETPYTWSVITCGGDIGAADQLLRQQVKKSGLDLKSVFSLKMPDNYVLLSNPPTLDMQDEILKKAENSLQRIIEQLEEHTETAWSGKSAVLKTSLMYPLYKKGRKTSRFYVTDVCVGCRRCAEICPVNAIDMRERKPRWVKEQCTLCLACINRCPAQAIQYRKQTEGRRRYENPVLR